MFFLLAIYNLIVTWEIIEIENIKEIKIENNQIILNISTIIVVINFIHDYYVIHMDMLLIHELYFCHSCKWHQIYYILISI
jgi:hypothetical protein